MSEDNLQIRCVKVVATVRPRRLTGSQVIEAVQAQMVPGTKANGDSIYTTLGLLSKNNAGPLNRERNGGGVNDYGIPDGFDVDAWIESKRGKTFPRMVRTAPSGEPAPKSEPDDLVGIVQVLSQSPRRLTKDELVATKRFEEQALVMALALGCRSGGPLERDRVSETAPYRYGLRADLNVKDWLAERDSAIPETAAAQVPVSARHGGDALVAPSPATSASPGTPASAAAPKTATAPAAHRIAPSKEGAEPVRAAVPPARAPSPPAIDRPAPRRDESQTNAAPPAAGKTETPASPGAGPASAAPKREQLDLMTELTIIAAANLAAAVRACDPERVSRELHTFERADRLREQVKAERA